MTTTNLLDAAVRDRALDLDLETLAEATHGGRLAPDRRRSPRSLSSLALVVAAAAVVVAIVYSTRAAGRHPPRAAERSEPHDAAPRPDGHEVRTRDDLDALPADARHVVGIGLTDDAMPGFARLRELRTLVLEPDGFEPWRRHQHDVAAAEFTLGDRGLAALASNRKLRRLELHGAARVTAAGIAALHGLPLLEALVWTHATLADDDVAVLRALPLRELDLTSSTELSPDGIARVVALPGIESLTLSFAHGVTATSLRGVGEQQALQRMELTFSPRGPSAEPIVDDGVLRALAKLPAFRDLTLSAPGAAITDAGLRALFDAGRLNRFSFAQWQNEAVTPGVFAHAPPSLEQLEIAGAIGGGPLRLPSTAPRLRVLELHTSSAIDATTFAPLAKYDALERVVLELVANVGASELRHVVRAPALAALRLTGTTPGTDGLRVLGSARRLEELDLSAALPGFSISNGLDVGPTVGGTRALRGLASLASLRSLRHLSLDSRTLDVAELRALEDLELARLSLRNVDLTFDDVTPDAESLRAVWPDASIQR